VLSERRLLQCRAVSTEDRTQEPRGRQPFTDAGECRQEAGYVVEHRELDSVAALLTHPVARLPLEHPTDILRYVDRVDETYVSPTLAEHVAIDPGKTAIVLLSAPAAAGKSALAREIARRAGAPLLDLSRIQVGSGSLAGVVTNSFGYAQASTFLEGLEAGSQLLVLDALDEAELRAGERNFQSFILDLGKFGRSRPSLPTLVLLGRTETTDWVALTLDEEAIPYSRFELEFLDESGARRFLELKLDRLYKRRGEEPRHRTHAVPYSHAREALFRQIYDVFRVADEPWNDLGVRRFLGYAPVLDVLSRYLAVPNHHALQQRLERRVPGVQGRPGPWRILLQVVEALLVREQEKFVAQTWNQLEAVLPAEEEWQGQQLLYSPQEQVARLLARVEGGQVPSLPLMMPEVARQSYEDAVATALTNHPFLEGARAFVNVVFREYLHVLALTDPSVGSDTVARVRQSMRSVDYLPSPLLAGFLQALTAPQPPVVSAQDTGTILESVMSGEARGNRAFFGVVPIEEKVVLMIFDRPSSGQRIEPDAILSFDLANPDSGVVLLGRVSNGTVLLDDGTVEILGRGGRVTLGPSLIISCNGLIVQPSEVVVLTNSSYVDLEAKTYLGPGDQRIQRLGSGSLFAHWDDMAYPWLEYREDLPKILVDRNRHRIYIEFRRLLLRFKDKHGNYLQAFKPMMDNLIIGGNETARKVLQRLVTLGLVTSDALFYYLDLSALAAEGVNYPDIRQSRLTPSVTRFLDRLSSDT
jgi:hypothetical protein